MIYQLGQTLTDAMVLSIIDKEDSYGYSISQNLKKITDLKESTLYPVLRRLQNSGYLRTYDQPFQGRNRKYYSITEMGKEQYRYYREEWIKYRTEVEEVILGGREDEQK